jgi:hypothetical protein
MGRASIWIFDSEGKLISSMRNLDISNDRASGKIGGKLLLYSGFKFIGSSLYNNLIIYEKKIIVYGIPGFKISLLDINGRLILENADYDYDGKIELSLSGQNLPLSCKMVVYIPTYTIQMKKEFTYFVLFEIKKIT